MKRKQATDIKPKVRETVKARDNHCCVYCGTSYMNQLAHIFINRSHGGLGIEQNLACLCIGCHMALDNGKAYKAEPIREVCESYLKHRYPDFDFDSIKYRGKYDKDI